MAFIGMRRYDSLVHADSLRNRVMTKSRRSKLTVIAWYDLPTPQSAFDFVRSSAIGRFKSSMSLNLPASMNWL
jgi:hypothetical protein